MTVEELEVVLRNIKNKSTEVRMTSSSYYSSGTEVNGYYLDKDSSNNNEVLFLTNLYVQPRILV